ncbi:hypothetical protein [Glycocaulis sp.]
MSLEGKFEARMRDIYRRSDAECDYRPTYFLQMIDERGGVGAAKALLAKPMPSDGFTKLFELGRLDLAMESLVLEPEWASLFTDAELNKARRWLGR